MLSDFASRIGLPPYVPRLNEWLQSLSGQLTVVAGGFLCYTSGLFSSLAAVVSMLFIVYYLLLDGQRIIMDSLKHIPEAQRSRVRRILDQSADAVSGYIMCNFMIRVNCGAALFVVVLAIPYANADSVHPRPHSGGWRNAWRSGPRTCRIVCQPIQESDSLVAQILQHAGDEEYDDFVHFATAL